MALLEQALDYTIDCSAWNSHSNIAVKRHGVNAQHASMRIYERSAGSPGMKIEI